MAGEVKAKSAPKRGTCPVCAGTFNLTKSGGMRYHNGDVWVGGWRQVCDGVGQPPKETTDGR